MGKYQVLQAINFGQRIAEDEIDELSDYFVETDEWQRIYAGDIDIVYGAKGVGKSAIYSLLLNRRQELAEQRRILVIAAENPKGAPVFQELVKNPEISEVELYYLWKLYFLALIADRLRKENISGNQIKKVIGTLEGANLLPRETSLSKILSSVADYVRHWFKIESAESGITIDPITGAPSFTGKITFREPSEIQQKLGMASTDYLLGMINSALEQSRLSVWLLLDRLDVAFPESRQLEHNALRALFRAYLDLQLLDSISLKIFLRNDIWNLVTQEGLRGASHITRGVTISWDEDSLLNLMIRRALNNPAPREFYQVSQADILSSTQKQLDLFNRIFPPTIDSRRNSSQTLKWMLTHTQDATGKTAPRELIHLLSCTRKRQLQHLAVGRNEPQGEAIFDLLSLKEALPEVSRVRFEQTLCAEFPAARKWLEKLERQKTQQTLETLAAIWGVKREKAQEAAAKLVEIGFFEERRGLKGEPTFWVPFLYRDALNMIQGPAR